MHVAHNIKRPMLRPAVVPKRLTFNRRSVHLPNRGHLEDIADSFTLQSSERLPQLLQLIANNMRSKLPVGTRHIPILAKPLWEIEDNGHGKDVIFPRKL